MTKERVGHVNRIKALLALHGVRDYRPLRRDRREVLAALRTGYGNELPTQCRREIERELSRLELVLQHLAEVEAAMAVSAGLRRTTLKSSMTVMMPQQCWRS